MTGILLNCETQQTFPSFKRPVRNFVQATRKETGSVPKPLTMARLSDLFVTNRIWQGDIWFNIGGVQVTLLNHEFWRHSVSLPRGPGREKIKSPASSLHQRISQPGNPGIWWFIGTPGYSSRHVCFKPHTVQNQKARLSYLQRVNELTECRWCFHKPARDACSGPLTPLSFIHYTPSLFWL